MLVLVVLANIAVYLVLLYRGFTVEDWTEMLASTQKLVPVLLFVSIVVSIVNAQIGHENNARLPGNGSIHFQVAVHSPNT